jgi:hypothetical protein
MRCRVRLVSRSAAMRTSLISAICYRLWQETASVSSVRASRRRSS